MSAFYIGLVTLIPRLCCHPSKYLNAKAPELKVEPAEHPEFEKITATYVCLACGATDIEITNVRLRGGLDAFLGYKYAEDDHGKTQAG